LIVTRIGVDGRAGWLESGCRCKRSVLGLWALRVAFALGVARRRRVKANSDGNATIAIVFAGIWRLISSN